MDEDYLVPLILAGVGLLYLTKSTKTGDDNKPITFSDEDDDTSTEPVLPSGPLGPAGTPGVSPEDTIAVDIEGGMTTQLGVIYRRYPNNVYLGRSDAGVRKLYIAKRGVTRGDWEYLKRLSAGTLPFSGKTLLAEFHNMNLWRTTWQHLDLMIGASGYSKVSLASSEQIVVHLKGLNYETVAFVYNFNQALGTVALQQEFLDSTHILAGKKPSSVGGTVFGATYEPISDSSLWEAVTLWINKHSTL
jgi:hypothetical protein